MPLVLMYNLSAARQASVRLLCARLKIRTRVVEKDEYAKTIGELAGAAETGEPGAGGDFDEEMLVMCGFSQSLLDAFLKAFRSYHVAPIGLKAILTPTNAEWDSAALYHELCGEREAIRKGLQAHD